MEPINAALLTGLTIGLVGEPLQYALFDEASTSVLRVVGRSIELLASPAVCMIILTAGASCGHLHLDISATVPCTAPTPTVEAHSAHPTATSWWAALHTRFVELRSIIVGACVCRLLVAPSFLFFALYAAPAMRPASPLTQVIALVTAGCPIPPVLVMLMNGTLGMEVSAKLRS